jgi:hypothetical protein
MAMSTMDSFIQINDKINTSPNDIEELSNIREFIAGVPGDIEKLEAEIRLGM